MPSLKTSFVEELTYDERGLIPAITQDWLDGTILMMAWMNKESIKLTLQTGEVHYWSRSRNELWHKGKTSGNFQKVKSISYDCDSDALLLTIEQINSIACHTGARSCFFRNSYDLEDHKKKVQLLPPSNVCSDLFNVIKDRKKNPEKESYTNSLLEGGDNKILKKIGEESAEFIMACKDKDQHSIASEAADLIFHLQVALSSQDVEWEDVLRILASRRGAQRRSGSLKKFN